MHMTVKDTAGAEGAGLDPDLTQDLGEEDIPDHVAEAVVGGPGLLLPGDQDLLHHVGPELELHAELDLLLLLKDLGHGPGLCHAPEAGQNQDLFLQKEQVVHPPEARGGA